VVAVAGLLRQLRGQDADVAGHTWLPDAHVQAPTAGSVILAGVLLKMGGYGFIRFSLPMFPDASAQFVPLCSCSAASPVVVTSLIALVQHDMKKLIAYSSVAHMAFVTFGLFALNRQGIEGALIVMLSHGLVSGALFLCVGVIYDRLHTREIARYGGLADNMPKYALLFLLFTMASVGLPGTSGFVGEFLALVGTYERSSLAAVVATTGIILGAAYMLYLYWRVVYGTQRNADAAAMKDIDSRELWLLAPIAAAVLWMGIYPESFMRPMRADVGRLVDRLERSTPPSDATSPRARHPPPKLPPAMLRRSRTDEFRRFPARDLADRRRDCPDDGRCLHRHARKYGDHLGRGPAAGRRNRLADRPRPVGRAIVRRAWSLPMASARSARCSSSSARQSRSSAHTIGSNAISNMPPNIRC
jgi:hypothetical protein